MWFKKLYDFIGEDYFEHDFNNIEQVIRENDAGYGWGENLHELRTGKLEYLKSDAKIILGDVWPQKLHNTEFWKKLKY